MHFKGLSGNGLQGKSLDTPDLQKSKHSVSQKMSQEVDRPCRV